MWLDEVVNALEERNRETYTLTTSVSPTGIIHIGKLRDILLVYFVHQALVKKGINAKTILYWDDYDVFHKGNEYIDQKGLPLISVKDERNNSVISAYKEIYYNELCKLGVNFDIIISQADRYIRREYDEFLNSSYSKRTKIQKIQSNATPLIICRAYCPVCSRILDNTEDCLTFYCKRCCENFKYSRIIDINYKLPFYIEWASRWVKDRSDFEPIGIDHASPEGVFWKSKQISEKLFGYPAPVYQRYEFVGGSKGVKLSVSSKNGLSITKFLKIFPREIIFWIFFKTDPKKYLILDIYNKDYYLNSYLEFIRLLDKPTSHFNKFLDIMGFSTQNQYINIDIKRLFQFLEYTYNDKTNEDRIIQLPNFESEFLISAFKYWRLITGNVVSLKSIELLDLTENQQLLLNRILKFLLLNKDSEFEQFKQVATLFKGEQKEIKIILFGTYKIPELSKMLFVYSQNILDFYGVENDEY